jgi:hypothetical protein
LTVWVQSCCWFAMPHSCLSLQLGRGYHFILYVNGVSVGHTRGTALSLRFIIIVIAIVTLAVFVRTTVRAQSGDTVI